VRVWLVLLICILTAASCCVCLLSDFLGLTCVHQSGMTALMWAVYSDCSRSVELLLDGGANTEIRDVVCIVMTCDVMPFDVRLCHVM
jgi:Ankyrin repeat